MFRECLAKTSDIREGSFYVGGPVCLAAYLNGEYIGSIKKEDWNG